MHHSTRPLFQLKTIAVSLVILAIIYTIQYFST
jgi:hypothetical protein